MLHAVDAIVTGIGKSRALVEQSFAPLALLRQEGLLRNIICVTWNSPGTDGYANLIGGMADVALVRIPEPSVSGVANQRGVVCQIENLRAALDLVPGADDVVLKLRPDFVCDTEFLRQKIGTFDSWSAVRSEPVLGTEMPKPVLHSRIWVPWADSNQPFYYEDAVFCGRKRDLTHLVTDLSPGEYELLGDCACGSFVHVVRYAKPFLGAYPLFSRYLSEYRPFLSDMEYRSKLIPHILNDGFFWHLLVAHAWILHSQFHVDAGEPAELLFYSNTANRDADWSRPQTLKLANPYDNLSGWRNSTHPARAVDSVARIFGRLVDDDWQTGLFTEPKPDFPGKTLVRILENIARCADGRLSGIEENFYCSLAQFHSAHRPQAADKAA